MSKSASHLHHILNIYKITLYYERALFSVFKEQFPICLKHNKYMLQRKKSRIYVLVNLFIFGKKCPIKLFTLMKTLTAVVRHILLIIMLPPRELITSEGAHWLLQLFPTASLSAIYSDSVNTFSCRLRYFYSGMSFQNHEKHYEK